MFRLLVNSRDELSLAAACQAPGLELTAPDFLAIRRAARARDLPMYQVRVSVRENDRQFVISLFVVPENQYVQTINVYILDFHANASWLKGLSHLVQSCLLYRSCMSKDSARSTGHVDHFFPIKILRSLQEINA